MLVTPTIRLMVKLYLKRDLQNEKVYFFNCLCILLYLLICFTCSIQVIPITTTDNYSLVEALVSRILLSVWGLVLWN